jgi:hypothetical protein
VANITSDMIDTALARCPFKCGDRVRTIPRESIFGDLPESREGTVVYIYYNGFCLVDFGEKITGGIFNNDSTYRWSELEATK